jgi:hypothetical protein
VEGEAKMTEQEEFEFRLRFEREKASPKVGIRGENYADAMDYTGRNQRAGLARGAGSIGATLLTPYDMAMGNTQSIGNPERRAAMDAGAVAMGGDPNSAEFQTTKLLPEIAGTMGIGSLLAKGAQAIPFIANNAPGFINALRTAGMTTGGNPAGFAPKAADLATRTAAGATVGGASAGLVNPEDSGKGAAIGGATPVVLKAAGAAGDALGGTWNSIKNAFSNTAARGEAGKQLAGVLDPTEIARLQQRGKIPLSVAATTQNPNVARMEQASRLRNPDVWYGFDQNQGKAVFDEVWKSTDEATQMAARAAARKANWQGNWADVEKAIDPQEFAKRIPKFQQDIDKALMSPEAVNPSVASMLKTIKQQIAEFGDNFSPAHLQQIRANLSGKFNPMSPNAFASAPRDSMAVKSVMKEVDDILNASSGGVWSKVTKGYVADSAALHQAKAASKIRGSFVDADTGRVTARALDASGDVPTITEAGLSRSMNAARQPVTQKLALSPKAEGDLSQVLDALRSQNIVQNVKKTTTAGGGSDTVSNLTSLAPGGTTKNLILQVAGAIKEAGSAKTQNQLAQLLTDPQSAEKLLKELAAKKPNAIAALLKSPDFLQLGYRTAPVISAQ